MTTETQEIVLGAKVSERLHTRILAEQARVAKLTGIKPTISEIVRMLLEKALDAGGKKR